MIKKIKRRTDKRDFEKLGGNKRITKLSGGMVYFYPKDLREQTVGTVLLSGLDGLC